MRAAHLLTGLVVAITAFPDPAWSNPGVTSVAKREGTEPIGIAQRLVDSVSRLKPATQIAGRTYQSQSLEQLMAHHKVSAVSLAVVSGGRVVWAKAYGMADPESVRPANSGTLFQAASISKPVAGMGALALVEAGKLQLDGSVNELLKKWRVPDAEIAPGASVTLRHLLTHTGGLTVHGFPGYAAGKPLPDRLQVLDGVAPANTAAVRITKMPGTEWRYSGGGYTVLEQGMTDVTGEPFAQLMERLVLKPTGMSYSSYGSALPKYADNLAVAHRSDGKAVAGRHHSYVELAAAGLWTTPTDLAHWLTDLSAAFRGAEGHVLQPSTARSMLTPGRGDWGLGLPVRGTGEALNFSHGGANEGFRALLLAYPNRDDGLVIMTNSDNGSRLNEPLRIAIGEALGWSDAKPQLLESRAITAKERRQLIGRYVSPSVTLDVAVSSGRLMITQAGSDPVELVPLAGKGFVVPDRGVELDFTRDHRNRITGLTAGGLLLKRAR